MTVVTCVTPLHALHARYTCEQALNLVASASGVDRIIDDWQIAALVESLKGSNLCDDAGRVDYAAFVQAFYIVDTSIPP